MRYLHTMVRVSDLDASLDFYCNKLGLQEVRRIENEKGPLYAGVSWPRPTMPSGSAEADTHWRRKAR